MNEYYKQYQDILKSLHWWSETYSEDSNLNHMFFEPMYFRKIWTKGDYVITMDINLKSESFILPKMYLYTLENGERCDYTGTFLVFKYWLDNEYDMTGEAQIEYIKQHFTHLESKWKIIRKK